MDKRHVDRSFSLAATSYDTHAGIQRRIGEALISGLFDRLQRQSAFLRSCRVVDAGCGTGYFTEPLISAIQRWQTQCEIDQGHNRLNDGVHLVALDRSAGMLEVCERKHGGSRRSGVELYPLQADLECLPLRSECSDLIFSNLAMQWLEQPGLWFAEAVRVLRPGGWLACSTLLPGSLAEIQTAWAGLDEARHVNHFAALETLQAAAPKLALITQQRFTEYFSSALEAMRSVKGVGAHTVLHGARQQLTTPDRMKAVLAAYEQVRRPEGIPLSYEVGFIFYQKPVNQDQRPQ